MPGLERFTTETKIIKIFKNRSERKKEKTMRGEEMREMRKERGEGRRSLIVTVMDTFAIVVVVALNRHRQFCSLYLHFPFFQCPFYNGFYMSLIRFHCILTM